MPLRHADFEMSSSAKELKIPLENPEGSFLRNLWYYAMPGHRLKIGCTLPRVLLDEPVLMGRAADGMPFALRNLCPHRGALLSDGKFDGVEIECCYHGWRFDVAGRCTGIPSLVPGQHVALAKIRVQQYPCRELQGNIWVFMGDEAAEGKDIPRLPEVGERPYDLVETIQYPVHADYAVAGLIDPAHGAFVHESLYWRTRRSMHVKTKRFAPSALGFSMLRHRASKNSLAYRLLGSTPETEITFELPGIRVEHIRVGRHVLVNMTTVTPVDATTSEVTNAMYWTMPWLTILKPLLRRFMRRFLRQDASIFVKLRKGLEYSPPAMLMKDADTQVRWYYQLKREYVSSAREGRPFKNPVPETDLHWRS